MKKYRAGQTVHVISSTDEFDYILKKQDVIDIKTGEWESVGLTIVEGSCNQSSLFRFLQRLGITKKSPCLAPRDF